MKTTKSRLAHYRAQAAKYHTDWHKWYFKGTTFANPNNVRTRTRDILTDSLDW